MTTPSDEQKYTKAAEDVDATVDTNMDVAAAKVTTVVSTSEAASASIVQQATSSLDLSELDERGSRGDGDAVANENIEGEGAARTTQQVVVSLTDMFFPQHDCCDAPTKTATC